MVVVSQACDCTHKLIVYGFLCDYVCILKRMNSTKPLIKLGARLTNNNYHLFIDKDMHGPNKAIFNSIPSNLIALF